MKKTFTFLKVFLTLVLLCGAGNAWGETVTYKMTPNNATTGNSATAYVTNAYSFTYNEVSWSFNQWNPSTLQIKTNQSSGDSEFNFKNTSAFPGRITKVVITFSALTVSNASNLCFVGGNSEITSLSGGTAGTWNSEAKTLTWTPTETDEFTYFAFYQNGKAATGTNKLAVTDAIEITYASAPTTAYTVTFDPGENGTCLTTSSKESSAGAGIALPQCTASTGYTFVGWSTNEIPTSANVVAGTDGKYHPSSDCTLYAYYTANQYSITYKDQGGADFSGTYGSSNPTTHTYGTATTLVNPSKVHYTFGGWFTSSDCSGDAVTELEATAYTDNITLYAKWTEDPKYTVTFNVNGSQYGDVLSLYNGQSVTFPSNPSVADVEFIGWVKDAITEKQDEKPTLVNTSTEKMGEANVIYYAVFAYAEVGSEYTQITSTSALEAGGRYLIVGNSSSTYKALPVDKAETLTTVTPSSSKITNPADELIWTLEGTASNWKIKSVSNGKYLQISGGNLTFESSTDLTWNASVSSSKFTWTSSASSGNKILSYYANGNKFNAYTNANTVYMYKANVNYSDYCTTVVPLVKHTLTISSVENGTLTVKKGNTILTSGTQVAEGAVITLTAAPNTHYHFVDWTGTVDVDNYTFKMPTSDATIGVRFEEDTKYHITANVPEGGTYTVKVGDADAVIINGENEGFDTYAGTAITMTSTADETHKVHSTPFVVKNADDETVSLSTVSGNKTFNMPEKAVTITAQFVNTYSIAAGKCVNGVITKIADKEGNEITRTSKGSTVVVSAKANEHYHLSGMYYVKEGEETHYTITETDDVYSFSMVASDIAVYAEFEEDENVSITWSINGKTDVIAASKVYVGEPIKFPTDVDDVYGNKFMGWVGESDKEYSNETTAPTYANANSVNATVNATYYAVFAKSEGSSTDYSYTITTSTSPYDKDGYKTGQQQITATCQTDNTKTFNVVYQIDNFGKVSNNLQIKKSGEGYMYNTTDLGSITSVTIENGSNLTTYYGTSANPKSGTSVGSGNGYFRIVAGNSAGTCSSITVNFTKGSYTYSNYTTELKPVTITFHKAADGNCYATFYANYDAVVPDGVRAYGAELNDDNTALNMNRVEDGKSMAAYKGYVLIGSTEDTRTIEIDAEGTPSDVKTSLTGVLKDTDASTLGDIYVFSQVDNEPGFYVFNGATLGANKAYLPKPNTTGGALSFIFDDATMINSISNTKNTDVRYNLNGQAVSNGYKGIVIVNGKKYFNK